MAKNKVINKLTKKALPSANVEGSVKKQMKITFRDKTHFYKVVSWLNDNFGKGKKNWTINGKVLKNITGYNAKPITRSVTIYNVGDHDPEEVQLYLTLI